MTRRRFPAAFAGVSAALASPAGAAAAAAPGPIEQRNDAYRQQLEQYFRKYLVDEYPARASKMWHRSYTGVAAFLRSVEPNRRRYREIFAPPAFERTGPVVRNPHASIPGTEWISIPVGPLQAEALLAFPPNASGPVPLVVAQHGIGSFPERVFGADDPTNLYHDYGHALVKQGFAVLAPFNLASVEKRNRIERLARLAGTTLPGIELARMQILLDEVLADKRVDAERVGMWGISLGGMATMFWMPLELRIRCGIVTAWFNHRRNKMVIPDKRYSCFLETTEDHAFFRGWLTEFTDSDVASLICPRPLLVQTGKADGIAWRPQVVEEFEASKEHYRKLGMEERIAMDLHGGGHEIRVESGIPFLERWLKS
jgi:dienelactone hydrolase